MTKGELSASSNTVWSSYASIARRQARTPCGGPPSCAFPSDTRLVSRLHHPPALGPALCMSCSLSTCKDATSAMTSASEHEASKHAAGAYTVPGGQSRQPPLLLASLNLPEMTH